MSSDSKNPLPRAPRSRRSAAALYALGLFALAVSAMVIYTFFAQLAG